MIVQRNRQLIALTKNVCFGLLCVIGWGAYSQSDDKVALPFSHTSNEEFVAIDETAKNAYRAGRYERLKEALSGSNLSSAHQELFANALADVFVGAPVSDFGLAGAEDILSPKLIEEHQSWLLSDASHEEIKDRPVIRRLTVSDPFEYFPPNPFSPETAKLIEDSESEATVAFQLDLAESDLSDESLLSNYRGKLSWIFQVTANKNDQSPKLIEIKLKRPLRKLFRFKITTLSTKLHFSFIESCGCFGVNTIETIIEGFARRVGQIDIFLGKAFQNIRCKQPPQLWLPKKHQTTYRSEREFTEGGWSPLLSPTLLMSLTRGHVQV
ncbi:MAG: hypothetical protein F4X56_08560 [Gammaproteobacteria bacterium]|nr:hypothetical protein [Gammaproteobacteria bacterium]